jgi:hypothetical protein
VSIAIVNIIGLWRDVRMTDTAAMLNELDTPQLRA